MPELKEILQQLLRDNEEIYSVIGRVVEINEGKRVCKVEPLDDSAALFNVRLQAQVSAEIGLVLFPKEGSEVTVTFISKDLAFVSQTSEIEKVLLDINGFSLLLDKENFTLNSDKMTTTGDTVKFTAQTLFEAISAVQIKLTAANIALAGNVAITGTVALNGGANGGVPMSTPLSSEINEVKNDINQLKAIFASWSPVSNDGGSALKAAVSGYASSPLDPTNAGDISNDDFTQ